MIIHATYQEEEAIEDYIEWLDSGIFDNDTHVYCTKCKSFYVDNDEVPQCEHRHECELNDCEDSKPYSDRPHYVENETNLSCEKR